MPYPLQLIPYTLFPVRCALKPRYSVLYCIYVENG